MSQQFNKIDVREGERATRTEHDFRQDLVTMNVRLERILEAQTQRVADATVEAVQSQLKHLEQRLEEMHRQLLPLRHLSASPLPGAVEAETQDAMPLSLRDAGHSGPCPHPSSRSHVSEVESPPGRAQLSERMEQGIQTDPLQKGPEVSSTGEPKIVKPAFIKSVEVPPSIGLPKPRGSRSNAPIPLAIDASLSICKLDPSRMSRWRRTLNQVVRHNSFEVVVMLTLLASSATLGFETHMNMQNVSADPHVVFRIFDIFWCAAFLVELALRIIADGSHFLNSKNPEFTWNVTDTALVALSTADEVIFLLGFALELSQFRLLRMVRLVRVLRLLRVVRFCSDLRIMVNGILGSVKTLFWAMLLLGIVMFIFGVTFMQLAYNHLRSGAEPGDIMEYFGTLGRSMLTLFMAISGGVDWKDAVAPLTEMSFIIDYLMGVYVFFTVFCFINVVTGIFVDNAKALGEEETLHQRAGEYLRRKRWVKEVMNLFAKMDISSEGDLSYEEFAAEIQDERVQDCFRHLGINVENHTADELFELFDVGDDGKIDQLSFEQAIRQFHGAARSIDVYKIRRDTQKIGKQLHLLSHALAGQHPSLFLEHHQLSDFLE